MNGKNLTININHELLINAGTLFCMDAANLCWRSNSELLPTGPRRAQVDQDWRVVLKASMLEQCLDVWLLTKNAILTSQAWSCQCSTWSRAWCYIMCSNSVSYACGQWAGLCARAASQWTARVPSVWYPALLSAEFIERCSCDLRQAYTKNSMRRLHLLLILIHLKRFSNKMLVFFL